MVQHGPNKIVMGWLVFQKNQEPLHPPLSVGPDMFSSQQGTTHEYNRIEYGSSPNVELKAGDLS